MEPQTETYTSKQIVLVDDVISNIIGIVWPHSAKIALCSKSTLKMFKKVISVADYNWAELQDLGVQSTRFVTEMKDMISLIEDNYSSIETGRLPKLGSSEMEFCTIVDVFLMCLPFSIQKSYKYFDPIVTSTLEELTPLLLKTATRFGQWAEGFEGDADLLNITSWCDTVVDIAKGELRPVVHKKLAPFRERNLLEIVEDREQCKDEIVLFEKKVEGEDYAPLELYSNMDTVEYRMQQKGYEIQTSEKVSCNAKGEIVYTVMDEACKELVGLESMSMVRQRIDGKGMEDEEFSEMPKEYFVNPKRLQRQKWYLERNLKWINKVYQLMERIVKGMENATVDYLYESANSLLSCKEYMLTVAGRAKSTFLDFDIEMYKSLKTISKEYTITGNNTTLLEVAVEPLQCGYVCDVVLRKKKVAQAMFDFLCSLPQMLVTKRMYYALWHYEEFRETLSKRALVNCMHKYEKHGETEGLEGLEWRLEGNPRLLIDVNNACGEIHWDRYRISDYTKEQLENHMKENTKFMVIYWKGGELSGRTLDYTEVKFTKDSKPYAVNQQWKVDLPEIWGCTDIVTILGKAAMLHLQMATKHEEQRWMQLSAISEHWSRTGRYIRWCQILGLDYLLPDLVVWIDEYDINTALSETTFEEKYAPFEGKPLSNSTRLLRAVMHKKDSMDKWVKATVDNVHWTNCKNTDRKLERLLALECIQENIPVMFWEAKSLGVTIEDFLFLRKRIMLRHIGGRITRWIIKEIYGLSAEEIRERFQNAKEEE